MTDKALDIVKGWGEENRILLIKKYDELGLRASGQWAESLNDEASADGTTITAIMTGEDYTGAIAYGRLPNTDQGDETIRRWVGWAGSTFLKDWVANKGLSINPYAVAYKVAREGWSVPNPHNKGGLVDDVVNEKRIQILKDRLGEFYVTDIQETLIESLKALKTK